MAPGSPSGSPGIGLEGRHAKIPEDPELARSVSQPAHDRRHVFISYCRVDRDWVERIRQVMAPLLRQEGNSLQLWDDGHIQPGDRWLEKIETTLARAQVALLLVSAEFLASEFVMGKEVPALLRAAEAEGVTILWVPLSACLVRHTPIHAYQAVLPPEQTLDAMGPPQQRLALVRIAEAVHEALRQGQEQVRQQMKLAHEQKQRQERETAAEVHRMWIEEKDRQRQVQDIAEREQPEIETGQQTANARLQPLIVHESLQHSRTHQPPRSSRVDAQKRIKARIRLVDYLLSVIPNWKSKVTAFSKNTLLIYCMLLLMATGSTIFAYRMWPSQTQVSGDHRIKLAKSAPQSDKEIFSLCRSVQTIRQPKPDEFPEYKDLKDGLARFPPASDNAYGQDVWIKHKCYEIPGMYNW